MPARSIARVADLECLVVGGERRRQPALVGHERRPVAALPQLCGRAGAHQRRVLDRLGERGGGERDHEHVLHVDRAPGMRAAGEHVHHRPREQRGGIRVEQAPERRAGGLRRRQRARDRCRQDGVGAETREGRGAVEVAQRGVDDVLLGGVVPVQLRGDLAVDGRDGVPGAATGVAIAAVAPLVRLVAPGGRARRHDRAGLGAAGQGDDAGHGRRAA